MLKSLRSTLSKVALWRTLGASVCIAFGFAQSAIAQTTISLEAECTQVGEAWQYVTDANASGQKSLIVIGKYGYLPSSKVTDRIRFTFSLSQAENIYAFARILAIDTTRNSFYVRVDNGAWRLWSTPVASGYAWAPMLDSAFSLSAGPHTIDFTFREGDTRLDKLIISSSATAPADMGAPAVSCTSPSAAAVAKIQAVTQVVDADGNGMEAVMLDASTSIPAAGSSIIDYLWDIEGQPRATGVSPTVNLPLGTHPITLTVINANGATAARKTYVTVSAAQDANIWLEAEHAQVGGRWLITEDILASGARYAGAQVSALQAADDTISSFVRFETTIETPGAYLLYARVRATTAASNSFWVRLNGGDWKLFDVNQSPNFQWSKGKLADGTFSFTEGLNTIDFACRESGTQLDKIMIATDVATLDPAASVLGPLASNIDDTTTFTTYWLEAECAQVGSKWKQNNTEADPSGGVSLIAQNVFEPNPDSLTNIDIVRFNFHISTTGAYYIYARALAPATNKNACWVRINGGAWFLWNGLKTASTFQWNWMRDRSFILTSGYNSIEIAYRDPGFYLDRLYVNNENVAPSGKGPQEGGCGVVSAVYDSNLVRSNPFILYPNPSSGQFALRFDPTTRSPRYTYVKAYTVRGQQIGEWKFDNLKSPEVMFDLSNRSAGVYFLRVEVDTPDQVYFLKVTKQ
ncbi:Por secretion system C-terminal sorting domain-containing protein [Catalinimonas alkaloidigena]|uniref:Por secretion system C-terminal sorting domain-containing protein n=1 Tax=Catalinimonas alkaloidigena TaxID=1075417 RepID=A0A1G9EKF8_9BACT|nr:T9SS type A sorting domain-containing protein [Catalinimonas alkaloidigena]SDK76616.1 Por secretion system C-terminal sorting domain-containing protein [Catalinimonas alkaloidigena]